MVLRWFLTCQFSVRESATRWQQVVQRCTCCALTPETPFVHRLTLNSTCQRHWNSLHLVRVPKLIPAWLVLCVSPKNRQLGIEQSHPIVLGERYSQKPSELPVLSLGNHNVVRMCLLPQYNRWPNHQLMNTIHWKGESCQIDGNHHISNQAVQLNTWMHTEWKLHSLWKHSAKCFSPTIMALPFCPHIIQYKIWLIWKDTNRVASFPSFAARNRHSIDTNRLLLPMSWLNNNVLCMFPNFNYVQQQVSSVLHALNE